VLLGQSANPSQSSIQFLLQVVGTTGQVWHYGGGSCSGTRTGMGVKRTSTANTPLTVSNLLNALTQPPTGWVCSSWRTHGWSWLIEPTRLSAIIARWQQGQRVARPSPLSM
jgi:hypothetical protein